MAILLVVFLSGGSPKGVVMLRCSDKFLLDRHAIGSIPEDVENVKATPQRGVPVEPLVVDCTQTTIAAIDLGDHEKLVSLAHLTGEIEGLCPQRFEWRMNGSLDGSMEESWTEGDGNMREFDLREIRVS